MLRMIKTAWLLVLVAGAVGAYADTGDAAKWIKFGKKLVADQRLDDAVMAFKKALEYDPSSEAAHTGLGDCYNAKGDMEAAVQQYKLAKGSSESDDYEKNFKKQIPKVEEEEEVKPVPKKKTRKPVSAEAKLSQIDEDIEKWESQAGNGKLMFWGGLAVSTGVLLFVPVYIEDTSASNTNAYKAPKQNPIWLPLIIAASAVSSWGAWNWYEASSNLSMLRSKRYDLSLTPFPVRSDGDFLNGFELQVRFGS